MQLHRDPTTTYAKAEREKQIDRKKERPTDTETHDLHTNKE